MIGVHIWFTAKSKISSFSLLNILILPLALILGSANAFAVTVDFRDSASWSGSYGEDSYFEKGSFFVDGEEFTFDASESGGLISIAPGNGEWLYDLSGMGGLTLQSIQFIAPGIIDGQDHEYALRGLTLTAVPLPGAAVLFGSALLLMGFVGSSRFIT